MKAALFGWLVYLAFGGALTISIPTAGFAASTSLDPSTATPASEESETPAFSVTIHATDASTKQPLTSIRVVPTPYKIRARQVTWQSQYLKTYESLPATYSLERGWETTQLRIEADGYRPVVTPPMPRKTGIELAVELEPHEGITGRVLNPDGKPAADATVAVCTWTNEVTVRDGTLKYGHHAERLRGLVQTADDGSFQIPGEVDEWVLVVAHESGYAEPTADEFAKQSTVTLKPWGRLEGELVVDGAPWAGQSVNIGAGRGDVQVMLHYSAGETKTDATGGFVADRLPPVKMFVTPMFKHGESSFNLLWFSGLVEIKAGEATRISLPRVGQVVTGQLALPEDSGLSLSELEMDLSISLRSPSVSGFRGSVNQSHAAYGEFMRSEQGKSFRRDEISVAPDGRFRIEGLPETHYFLRAMAYRQPATPNADRGEAVAGYTSRVAVPAITDSAKTVDLGVLPLKLYPAAKP